MELGKDYFIADDKGLETSPVEILIDPFKGVKFRFTVVRFKLDKNEDGEQFARVQFDYELLDPMKFTETQLRKNKVFEEFVGLILNSIMLDATEHGHMDDVVDVEEKDE
jgi:hypothetical protein